MNTTTKTLFAAAITGLAITSANAAVTTIGTPDFSLSSSTAAGTTHDNLPASFDSLMAPGAITPSATSSNISFPESNLTDGELNHSNTYANSWASADVAGVILNWGWANRTPGDYEIKVDGTSLGSIRVDDAGGGTSSLESTEPNTYIIFDSVQSGATKIEVITSNGGPTGLGDYWGLDEIEVYTGVVPEPGSLALLGLGGLCVLRRRRG